MKILTPFTSPPKLSEFHVFKNKDHKIILAEWSQLDEYKMVLWTHQKDILKIFEKQVKSV